MPKLLDQVSDLMRARHYSPRTEEAPYPAVACSPPRKLFRNLPAEGILFPYTFN